MSSDPIVVVQAGDRDWFGNVADKISHSGTSSVLIVFTEEAAMTLTR